MEEREKTLKEEVMQTEHAAEMKKADSPSLLRLPLYSGSLVQQQELFKETCTAENVYRRPEGTDPGEF